jgi:hypothetical protein
VSEDAPAGDSNPVQRALDLLFFAPVGVALTVAEDLPTLIAKGRERVETQIRNARFVGEFVVTQGQQDLVTRVGRLFGSGAASPPDSQPDAEASPVPPESPPPPPKPASDPADDMKVERALAGYDTLSASQVVRRLESLGPDELRAVHRYETSHRNRRTILNRTHQLLDARHPNGAAQ